MNRLLVTGASGFTGKHLHKFLSTKYSGDIITTDIVIPEGSPGMQIDLLNKPQVFSFIKNIRPNSIIHLAGIARSRNFEDIYTSNVFTTVNLLDSVVENKLSDTRILLISSSAVYGNSSVVKVNETTPPNPVNHYGNSKLLMEKIAQQYIYKYDLKIIIVRPFNLFGPGQDEAYIIPAFLNQLIRIKNGRQNPVIKVGDLTGKRDFIYIEDAIRAYWQTLTGGKIGEVYNVGSGYAISIQKVLDTMFKIIGISCKIQTDDQRIQPFQIRHIVADTIKINSLGWQNTTPFEEALRNIISKNPLTNR
jgi:nucleoside-diphosphate-sugar epimerase